MCNQNEKPAYVSKRLSEKFGKLWLAAEVVLFVLVGAVVDISYTLSAGLSAVLMIFVALLFRSVGVLLCVAGSRLTWKERLFCVIAYPPKATVQAAIGSVPLAQDFPVEKLFCLSLCLQSSSQLHLGQSGWMQPIKGCWKRKIKKDF